MQTETLAYLCYTYTEAIHLSIYELPLPGFLTRAVKIGTYVLSNLTALVVYTLIPKNPPVCKFSTSWNAMPDAVGCFSSLTYVCTKTIHLSSPLKGLVKALHVYGNIQQPHAKATPRWRRDITI